MYFYVLRYDDDMWLENGGPHNKTEYVLNKTNYAEIEFKDRKNPGNSWATPFVTGHKYKIHWAKTGIDFESIRADLSPNWKQNDSSIYFVHNYTDVRAKYDVKAKFGGVTQNVLGFSAIENDTIAAN
jgi:hypothetical protein